jgi:hydrogenase maturation factor
LATVLLPERGSDRALAEGIFEQIRAACSEVGATLCGGHTEITHGLDRPIVSGTMLGECSRDELVVPSGIRAGDHVIATKGIAIEGTAVLARELAAMLAERVPTNLLARMQGLLHDPGISVVADARIARGAGTVHALHDATEGGIAAALHEFAAAGGVGMEVDVGAIHVLDETRAICDVLEADPLGLLASGCLLIAVSGSDVPAVTAALDAAGIRAGDIGRAVTHEAGVKRINDRRERTDMPVFARDEVARLLG